MTDNNDLPLEETPEYKFLLKLDLPREDFAIFGSGPMIERGLKPLVNDLDIIARGKAWEIATKFGEVTETPFERGKMVSLLEGKVEIFNDWISEKYDVNDLIDNAEIINGVKFVKLDEVLHYKEKLWRPKDVGDIKSIIDYEKKFWDSPLHDQVKERTEKQTSRIIPKDEWRFINKTVPIISGGLNPVLIPEFLKVFGTIDYITTMGGGVHSHPMGTQAGAKAVMQAYEAWKLGVTPEEYAEDREELKVALEFFSKKSPQAHKLHKLQGYEDV